MRERAPHFQQDQLLFEFNACRERLVWAELPKDFRMGFHEFKAINRVHENAVAVK